MALSITSNERVRSSLPALYESTPIRGPPYARGLGSSRVPDQKGRSRLKSEARVQFVTSLETYSGKERMINLVLNGQEETDPVVVYIWMP